MRCNNVGPDPFNKKFRASAILLGLALPAWSPVVGLAATTLQPSPVQKATAVGQEDDKEEGGEAPDAEDRASAGTGHGKGKATGKEGILGDV